MKTLHIYEISSPNKENWLTYTTNMKGSEYFGNPYYWRFGNRFNPQKNEKGIKVIRRRRTKY